jgi:hypothetical protein
MAMSAAASQNVEKKEAERRVLIAARKAGAPIPEGEVAGEEPDFRFQCAADALGVEVSEIMRPASSNHGILPAEAEAFHEGIMQKAGELFRKTSNLPTHVNVYFSNPRGQKQNKRRLVNELVQAVQQNRHRANPAAVLKGEELPEGFDHILITNEPREWWSGEAGGIHLSEIYPEVAAKIAAKNPLVPRYRANLPPGTELWLLLFSRVTVARSVPIPAGIEEWKFRFDFDRVFWFACLENRVVEFQRQ